MSLYETTQPTGCAPDDPRHPTARAPFAEWNRSPGRCPVRFDSAQRTLKLANENLMAVTRSVGTIEARPDRSLWGMGKGDSHAQRLS